MGGAPELPLPFDVVIVGAGMAGLVAAVAAARPLVSVLVLEKGGEAGGSMRLSGGLVWGYADLERARRDIPDGDAALQRIVIEGLGPGLAWLEGHGVALEHIGMDGVGDAAPSFAARRFDPAALIRNLLAAGRARGVAYRHHTALETLEIDTGGRVTGLSAILPDGVPLRIRAHSVVLATGGFQGDGALLTLHGVAAAERLWLRANPHSSGDALRAATDIGALPSPGLSTFYGHNMAAAPDPVPPERFLAASMKFGRTAVAVDRRGLRFTDESESYFGESLAQDTAALAGARAWYLLDGSLLERDLGGAGPVAAMVATAAALGGRVLRAADLAGLAGGLAAWGVDGERAVAELRRFDAAAADGRSERLQPPRRRNPIRFGTPPFCAVEVRPGITFTMGGLAVDGAMRVLRRAEPDRAPESESRPIPGLFAAGVDVGNLSHRRYFGGLSQALVTGRIAGERAALAALARRSRGPLP